MGTWFLLASEAALLEPLSVVTILDSSALMMIKSAQLTSSTRLSTLQLGSVLVPQETSSRLQNSSMKLTTTITNCVRTGTKIEDSQRVHSHLYTQFNYRFLITVLISK